MSDMHNEQHSNPNDDAPKSTREQTPASAWKRLLAKKWVFPATYMIVAAIILSLMWAYQGNEGNDDPALTDGQDPELSVTDAVNGVEVPQSFDEDVTAPTQVAPQENLQWPVTDPEDMIVLMPYYDEEASAEARAAAVIRQGNEYMAHMGISIGMEDQEPFDVLAAKSGTVTRSETLPMVGNLVEITHEDGLVTVYQSLENVMVSLNEQVQQGQVIAQAGRNELEKDLGVHLHFEVRENGKALNPQKLLPSPGALVPNPEHSEDVDALPQASEVDQDDEADWNDAAAEENDNTVVEDGIQAEEDEQTEENSDKQEEANDSSDQSE